MAATSTTSPSMDPRRPPNTWMVQDFHLVWLDGSMDEENNDDCRNSIKQLRHIINNVNLFTDVDECIDFITDINEAKTFLMVSGALSQIIVPVVQDIPQVSSVYICFENETRHEISTTKCSKVKGAYTDITSICRALKQVAQDYDHSAVSISFVQTTDGAENQNLDTLNQSFMYTQILKEILLTIDFDQEHMNKFLTYCREKLAGGTVELKHVEKLYKEYHDHQPIWWYTHEYSLYCMLNRALRLMEVDLIIKMGFFVRDLHNHITALHVEQRNGQNHSNSFIVYRGQGLSPLDFDQLTKTRGGLMSFNNFLSTSLDRAVSLAFAESNRENPDLVGVLFEITINPSISSSPFANVGNVSHFEEEEILFTMHSVFRIGRVEQIDKHGRLWQVELTLTGDNDPQLYALTERIREETFPTAKGWYRLGILLIRLGHFDKAEQVFGIMLGQTTEQDEKANIYHMLGLIKNNQGKYEEAVTIYGTAIEIKERTLPANHSSLATSYISIGGVHRSMGEYSKALSSYEKALEIFQKILSANHPHLATSYNNIGTVYDDMGEYSKALSYHEKALEIYRETLPANHPNLAASYSNIGTVYYNMGEDLKALSFYEKALEIQQKTLPTDHPGFATSYNNIGVVYCNMHEYSRALSYYEKAVEIREKILPANHPDLATSYNNIGGAYYDMSESSKALFYYEKSLQICQTTLPRNHPHLSASYYNISGVYDKMGKYSNALSYYGRALNMWQRSLPLNHPHLQRARKGIEIVKKKM